MKRRICTGITALVAALAVLAAPALADTETFGSSQTRTPSTSGPCTGMADCVVFQSGPASGGTNTATASGQVTDISVSKDAGALNIQPVVISGPVSGAPNYTIEAFGETIALNAGPGTANYPLATPLEIGPGDTIGIRYPDGAVPTSPQIFSDEAGNGGQATTLNGVTGPGTFPPAATLPDYDLLTRFVVNKTTGPPGDPYDLIVEAEGARYTLDSCKGQLCIMYDETPTIPGPGYPWARADVQNLGPGTSEQTQGEMTFVGFGDEVRTKAFTSACSLPGLFAVSCPVDPLQSAGTLQSTQIGWGELEFTDLARFRAGLPIQVAFIARVSCNTARETNCENNSSSNTLTFDAPAQSEVKRAGEKGLEGTAKPPAGGQVFDIDAAVLQLDGTKGFTGSTPGEGSPRAKRECLWLKNKRAKFSKSDPDGKTCNEPRWLGANGTEKWSYELKKPLPPGKYVAYVRATTSDGAVEFFFDDKDGNREEFKVKE